MIAAKENLTWKFMDREVDLSAKTLVMGILNVTPDSFSDGGEFIDTDEAYKHAVRMIEAGADIIDVGGESTRPGAASISADEELSRVLPVIEAISSLDVLISVDTTKAEVAAEVIKAGAHIVNDISGLQRDARMVEVVKESSAGVVIMHMRGTPSNMQQCTKYDDLLNDIKTELSAAVDFAVAAGISPDSIVIDPGVGFSKTAVQNLELINNLDFFKALGKPLLVGVSRKSFINHVIESPVDERLFPTCAAVAVSVCRGANIVRVHDVGEVTQVIRITDAILNNGVL